MCWTLSVIGLPALNTALGFGDMTLVLYKGGVEVKATTEQELHRMITNKSKKA